MIVQNSKNKKWYCRVQVNGERVHRLCKGCSKKSEAKLFEAELINKISEKQRTALLPKEVDRTFKEIIDNFLNYSKHHRSVYKHDLARCKIALEFFGRDTLAKDVNETMIEEFIMYLAKDKCNKTINLYLDILRQAYNRAIKIKWLKENPFTSDLRCKVIKPEIKYLSKKEEQKLLNACPAYFKQILQFALHTGLRKSDLLNLKWSNISDDRKSFTITIKKTGKNLTLPITDYINKIFEDIKDRYNGSIETDYVFVNPNTKKPYTISKFDKRWRKIRKDANLEQYRFHDLRHTFASKLIKNGVDIATVKELLGHSDVTTTMIYVHTVDENKIKALNTLLEEL